MNTSSFTQQRRSTHNGSSDRDLSNNDYKLPTIKDSALAITRSSFNKRITSSKVQIQTPYLTEEFNNSQLFNES
jgi:hypothetical protein